MMLLNPYRFGGGAPPPTEHRYWRLYVTANDGSDSYVSFSEIELISGGVDRTTGLGANCSQTGDGAVGPASGGVSDSSYNECGSSWSGGPYSWQIDLGSDYAITSMTLRSQRVVTGRTPTTFVLQGSGSASGPWNDVITVTGSTGWGVLEQRTFTA